MYLNKYYPPKLVAEIGCNHMGSIELAKELILLAKQSNIQYVKFQKRDILSLLSKNEYNMPHPVPQNSYGKTYGQHREFLEFSKETHLELFNFCNSNDMIYSTSVWDLISANEIMELNPSMIKVPSACNNNHDLLNLLFKEYEGEIHISLGMTYDHEKEDLIKLIDKNNANDKIVIYACTSGYPVEFKNVCLMEILNIRKYFNNKVKSFGFSGHHLGIAIDIAAYTLGANWIERHFTKDRTYKGTDHAASLEPSGLFKLNRDLLNTYESLRYKSTELLDIEVEQRQKLKFKKN
ncbi:MAG: N-acetylneuraminate synthase family protein [Alphaproteobacteria bacterium]